MIPDADDDPFPRVYKVDRLFIEEQDFVADDTSPLSPYEMADLDEPAVPVDLPPLHPAEDPDPMLMYPDAGMPVVQLSIQGHLDPEQHIALGEAIAPLREKGVLILGSGGAVHPLGDPTVALGPGVQTDNRAVAFNNWLDAIVTRGDTESLAAYRSLAPAALHAQPYPDHFMS